MDAALTTALRNCNQYKDPPPERVIVDNANPFESLEDKPFKDRFRFNKPTVLYLCEFCFFCFMTLKHIFLQLKHQFLSMALNRRLEYLIYYLITQIMSYFMIKSRLQDDGQVPSKWTKITRTTAATSECLISRGWSEKFTSNIHQRGAYISVPSENTFDLVYKSIANSPLYQLRA